MVHATKFLTSVGVAQAFPNYIWHGTNCKIIMQLKKVLHELKLTITYNAKHSLVHVHNRDNHSNKPIDKHKLIKAL